MCLFLNINPDWTDVKYKSMFMYVVPSVMDVVSRVTQIKQLFCWFYIHVFQVFPTVQLQCCVMFAPFPFVKDSPVFPYAEGEKMGSSEAHFLITAKDE